MKYFQIVPEDIMVSIVRKAVQITVEETEAVTMWPEFVKTAVWRDLEGLSVALTVTDVDVFRGLRVTEVMQCTNH
jgi:hypothetical protein